MLRMLCPRRVTGGSAGWQTQPMASFGIRGWQRDGRTLPTFVPQEFAAYLKCGRLEHGFLRVRCTQCHAERLVAFSCKRRGFCPSCGAHLIRKAGLWCGSVRI